MRFLIIAAILLAASPAVFAQTGYIGKIDLNGDGIEDLLESGPSTMFGNGGGPYSISIMDNDGKRAKQYLIQANHRFAIERFGKSVRLWAYWHTSASSGRLLSYTFTGDHYTKESIEINPGDSGTSIANAIYETIFAEKNLLAMKRIEAGYQVPPNPTGNEWGK